MLFTIWTGITTPAAGETAPGLRLRDRSPVAVVGFGFAERERIRVTLVATRSSVFVRSGLKGTFLATFRGTSVHRCDLVRVMAVGASGRHAVLKILPAPACMPNSAP